MASRLTKSAGLMAGAIALVAAWEGMRTKAYIPIPGDVPTICFGSTRGVQLGDTKTVNECKAMLGKELVYYETGMRGCLKSPDSVPDKVYITSLSLTYNIGVGNFCKSTVARKINERDYVAACNAFLAWNKAGGRVVPGLTNRRTAERKLCLSGV